MPYVHKNIREVLKHRPPVTVGELNYAITKLLDGFCNVDKLSYQQINDALGALEGAKLEFYRRVAVPYEEKKRVENGDVYIPR